MSKEIKALKKQIEKIEYLDDDLKIAKKKELLNLYKKLFSNKLMNENKEIVEDLFEAGWAIEHSFKEEKK